MKGEEAGFEHRRPSGGDANLKNSWSIQQEVLGQKLLLKGALGWAEVLTYSMFSLSSIVCCGLSRKSLASVWKLRQIWEVLKSGLCRLNDIDHSVLKKQPLILPCYSRSFFSITFERLFLWPCTYAVPQGLVPDLVCFVPWILYLEKTHTCQ